LRKAYSNRILLISAGRLVRYKRPIVGLEIVKKLADKNVMCSIIYAGIGEEEKALRDYAREHSIEDRLSIIGYTHNILDYFAAADMLVHPSVDESSCVVVKEAALVGLPVIVCEGVGDFDDYMENRKNGIVLTKENFAEEAAAVISEYAHDPRPFKQMAATLHDDLMKRFDIGQVIDQYNALVQL